MGAWKELDTIVKIDVDTEELKSRYNMPESDPYGGFTGFIDAMKLRETVVIEASHKAVETMARTGRSFQQQLIREVTDNPSGMLMTSIQEEQDGEFKWLYGTILNHIYPMSLEYGRKGFSAKKAKALAFYYKGELIFRKSVGPAKPRPFVAPSYKKLKSASKGIVEAEVMTALKKLG